MTGFQLLPRPPSPGGLSGRSFLNILMLQGIQAAPTTVGGWPDPWKTLVTHLRVSNCPLHSEKVMLTASEEVISELTPAQRGLNTRPLGSPI